MVGRQNSIMLPKNKTTDMYRKFAYARELVGENNSLVYRLFCVYDSIWVMVNQGIIPSNELLNASIETALDNIIKDLEFKCDEL